MKKLKMTISAMCAAAALSAFAVGKGTDSKGEYWEDASGKKHYYLFTIAKTGDFWSLDNNAYSRESAQAGTKETSWVANSILTLEKDTTYALHFRNIPATKLYGIEFETLNRAASPHTLNFDGGTAKYTIGEYGIHSVSGNSLRFYCSGEAERIHLAASQTWSGPATAELSSEPFTVIPRYAYNGSHLGYVTAEDDVTLTLEGDIFVPWLIFDHPITNMDVVVRSPAILATSKCFFYAGSLNARKLTIDGGCGMRFGTDRSFVPQIASADNQLGIGSQTEISPVKIAQTIVLTNGATLTALETTTVTGGVKIVSAGTTPNAFSGTFKFVDDETVIQIPAGATLDLTGAAFTGTGWPLFTGEGTLEICVTLTDGEYCNLEDWLARHLPGFEGDFAITVSNGTLVVGDATAIPSGSTIITKDDGAVLVVDDTDFNAETQLGGTRNVMAPSRLIVTDEEVTGEVVVNNGETLRVFGNGLGENASLTLWGGSDVMFHRTATISAPTWHTNMVYYRTFDASVTGTVASAMSVTTGDVKTSGSADSTLCIDSPGVLRLAGSGQLRNFRMYNGYSEVTSAYDIYGTQYLYGGHMNVCNGGHLRIVNGWQYLRLDCNTSRDACLEIAEGGTFEKVAGNCYTYIGTGHDYESKLLLTGGTFIHMYDAFALQGGGVIDIQSGVFQTGRRINCNSSATAENANIYVRNGTLRFNGGAAGYVYAMFEGVGRCTTTIDGNATLQVMNQSKMPDTTNETELAQCTWRCTEGSRLKVFANNKTLLTLHNFEADGLVFDTNSDAASARAIEVRIVDPKDPLALGYVLPGFEGSTITASNAVPDLVASYVVPEGVSFDTAALPTDWYENFGDVTLSNLTFETGSSLSFPFFGGTSPLSIAGRLALPESMGFAVASQGSHADVTAAPVVVPALGTVQPEGGTAFTCAGGVRKTAASLSVEEGALAFSYKLNGSVFSLR